MEPNVRGKRESENEGKNEEDNRILNRNVSLPAHWQAERQKEREVADRETEKGQMSAVTCGLSETFTMYLFRPY